MSVRIRAVVVGALMENCYIVWKDGRSDALIVDPGADAQAIRAALAEEKKTAAAVLLTHGHFDHTGALCAFEGLPIYISGDDDFMLNDPKTNVGGRFGDLAPRPAATAFVADGDRLSLAGMDISVLHTPGHTPGGVCYLFDDELLLTGDTLFRGAYGRVDHPGGDFPTLLRSLKRLLRLPKDYPIYPGHGESSTIFTERDGR